MNARKQQGYVPAGLRLMRSKRQRCFAGEVRGQGEMRYNAHGAQHPHLCTAALASALSCPMEPEQISTARSKRDAASERRPEPASSAAALTSWRDNSWASVSTAWSEEDNLHVA